jgi:F0F1-type ATP synthase membrane subunit b/b'
MNELQSVAAQLGIDQTIIPMIVLMFLLYLILSVVYLKPFQKLIETRKNKTTGSMDYTKELTSKLEKRSAQYAESLKNINNKVSEIIKTAEDEAKKEEAKIISNAQAEAKEKIQKVIQEMQNKKVEVLRDLEKEVPLLAQEVVAKVLGKGANL